MIKSFVKLLIDMYNHIKKILNTLELFFSYRTNNFMEMFIFLALKGIIDKCIPKIMNNNNTTCYATTTIITTVILIIK